MRRVGALTILVLAFFVAVPLPAGAEPTAASPPQRLADHVVLVSIDGLRPEWYLDRSWPAPTLQQLAGEGAHTGEVRGVFPSVTYPTHTTMVTGAVPARHGVYYNSPFEPAGDTGRWYWEASSIRLPTLWSAARAAGLTTAAVSWPVTVGAEIDWNVPEIWTLGDPDFSVEAQRRHSRPPGLLEELEREAIGRLTDALWSGNAMARDDRAGEIAAYLLARHRPGLLLLHVLCADHFQHELGREHATVRRAVGTADRVLGRLVEAAERAGIRERTAFIVTGDHGFADLHTRLAPNVWLAAAGLQDAQKDRGRWRATFHTSASSAFLHLREPGDEAAADRVRAVLAEQPPGIRKLFRVVEREELDRLGAAPEAALALALEPGVTATSSAEAPAVRRATGGSHGYLPDAPGLQTGLVAWGAGIRPGAVVFRMSSTDVAPLVAHLLGLAFEAPDGVLLPGLVAEPAKGE